LTQQDSQSWHEYENPPVVEVVCGILFTPIEQLLAPHLGLLWEKFKVGYPKCQEVPPLMPVIERFEQLSEPEMKISDTPPLPRIWFLDADDNRIIQVQRDRFLHNWKRMCPEDEYPRYRIVIETFRRYLALFQSFLAEADLGGIQPLQYEMTYVNIIPQGEAWDDTSELGRVFPDFIWRVNDKRFLAKPDAFVWRTRFVLPDRKGRLHTKIEMGRRVKDEHPLLRFELTARGIGTDRSLDGMWGWFDTAREWIVRGFTDLTGSEAQENIWRRTK